MITPATPLVGRGADLRQLKAVLTRASEGTGSIVLISGEAGIGKTRLCAELSRWHTQRGGRALLGRAAPQEASIPYAALADALRGARRAEPAVWEAARARAGILWAVAPELSPEASGPRRSADRLVLFEALLDAVDKAAGDGTALWVLDDLHWADDSTLEFVGYAARRVADLALVLAVTYREEETGPAHPWWPGLVRLRQEASVRCLPLARLCAAEGERIVRAVNPALPDGTVAGIVERGAGTPLLVEELASLASRPGDLLEVPDIVEATVQERAGRLDPTGRALLEVAAVSGLEVDAEFLASVLPEGRPGDLVSAGLLNREDEDRFRFRHPLLQEAAYRAVPAGRRRALHEQIAAVLSDSDRAPAERIAAHLERAGRPEAALAKFEAAAKVANRAGQVGRAATLRLAALQLARRHSSLAGQRTRLEEEEIRDLFRAGRWSELDPLVRSAWARRSALPPGKRAKLAAVFSAHLFWNGSIGQAFTVANDELAALKERGSLDAAGPLLPGAALNAWFTGDGTTARAFVDLALEVAQRTNDVDLAVRARRLEIIIAYGEQREPRAAIDRLRENAAFARAQGLAVDEARALGFLSYITGTPDDVKAASLLSKHTGTWFWLFALREATIRLMEGRREMSQAIFSQIRHELTPGVPTLAAWVDAEEARLYLHRGDLDEARKLLEGPNAASDASSCGLIGAAWSAARGWLAWEEGQFREACTHLAGAGADSVMSTYGPVSSGPALLALRVDALLRLGRCDEAVAAVSGFEAFNLGHDRFMAAALAAARFRLGPSVDQALTAERVTAAAPWPWLRALVGCWRGEFLQDAGAAEGAHKQFEAIGAQLGVDRAQAVLRQLGVRLPRQEQAYDNLSPCEIEVAELVAEGLSNPAIARRLYLSRPTVARHVAHILAKCGFSSRAQIAAWVAQRRARAPGTLGHHPSESFGGTCLRFIRMPDASLGSVSAQGLGGDSGVAVELDSVTILVELRILGPLELRGTTGSAVLGGDKPRRLLGALALHANEVLSADRLVDVVWGDSPPRSAHANLLTYLSSLRRCLRSCAGLSIEARPPGYRLLADSGSLDSIRFVALSDSAREVVAGDPRKAGLLLREALGLWRGPLLADVADKLILLQPRIAAFEEARLSAQVLCIETDLIAGRHAEVIGELAELTRDHPLHEQLRGQHMLALYRCGRQAEALAEFHQLREQLRDELGIDPGTELGRLYEAILHADSQLNLLAAGDHSGRGGDSAWPARRAPPAAARRRQRFNRPAVRAQLPG